MLEGRPHQIELALPQAAIDFFAQHGWWVTPPIMDDAALGELQYGSERFLGGERDREIAGWRQDIARENAQPVSQYDYVSLQIEEFHKFVRLPLLPALAAHLAGASGVRLFHDQLVVKRPGSDDSTVGWHTDKAYWSSCTSTKMLTAWVPLQDTSESMGPLAVWDGSHLWPDVETLHAFDDKNLHGTEDQYRRKGLIPSIKVLPLKRGQVSFHHCRLVHGSFPNRTERTRSAFAIHYQDDGNAFNALSNIRGRVSGHVNDILCRRTAEGLPDYADPDICPTLWPVL